MDTLNIVFSQDFEIKRLQDTLDKIEWYKEKGYRVSLPVSVNIDNKYNREDLVNIVKSDFDEGYFNTQIDLINKNWSDFESIFLKKLSEMGLEPSDRYTLYLTKYGVGGSYNPPCGIIINIQQRTGANLIKTLFHEIIHLNIEPLIQKYKIGHWEKERIVDLTLAKVLPEISQMQKLPIDCSKIDQSFNTNFPDMVKIIQKVSKII